ncbi:toxin-antitoxin system YwqK family antitoxin [Modicisalibacter radicis]|uniref:toxin-antitoxin system YwqK family antitoxin n=1 Tax=Halomonas sp. EAR18 TaxID=2518972 RepID=UPI00109D6DF2|nr:hypothetical protein [Halomonas sp. EAR18]
MNNPPRVARVGLALLLLVAGSAQAATYWLDKQLDTVARGQAQYKAEVSEIRAQPGWPITIRRVDDGGLYMESYVDDPRLGGDYKVVGPFKQYRDGGDHALIEKGQRSAGGETTGTITVYDRQGRIARTVEYDHSQRNGKMREYTEDGEVYRVTDYVDGKIDGKRVSFRNGIIDGVEHYRDGRMEGAAEYYYLGDKGDADHDKPPLRLRIHYENGCRDGWARNWTRQGQMKSETHYADGKKDGVERFFYIDDDGDRHLASIVHYRAGKLVGVARDFYRHERRIYADDGSQRLIEEADIYPPTGKPLSRKRQLGEGKNARTVTETFDRAGYLTTRVIDNRHGGRRVLYQFAGDGRLIVRRERVYGGKVGRFVQETYGGTIERGRYDDNGNRTGEVIETRNGELIAKSHYVDDERDGAYVRYDEQGRVIESGAYAKGKRSGVWRIHGANHYDQIWQGRYDNGKRVGHWEVLDDTGRLLGAGDYDDQGEENGVWVVYDDDGQLKNCPRYTHGQRGDTPDFDADDTPKAAEYCRDRLPDWAEPKV